VVLLGTIAREMGWDVRVYVEDIAGVDYRDVLTADLVGISTITPTVDRAYAMADALREYGVPVVMGGPHVTFLAEEALTHCDYVVRGEGEAVLPMLMEAVAGGGDLNHIPNLSYRDGNGDVHHNPRDSAAVDMDSLPYPDFDLIVGWKKAKSFGLTPIIPIQTSRGCPFGCNFCSVISMFGRKIRLRSVEKVVGELERYRDERVHVFFYDDNFAANKKWTKELLRALIGIGFRAKWSAQVRADAAFDAELLDLMKRANCSNVYVGFESVNPTALEEMKKKQKVEDMVRAVEEFSRHGIEVHGMFVFGFDSDTKASLNSTIRFAMRSDILSAQFLILTPLPGTPLYDTLKEQGRLTITDWSHYDAHHVVYRPHQLSTWELQWAQIKAHAKFYSRWRTLERLLEGHLSGSMIYVYARRLIHEWKRTNRVYLRALKLAERARDLRINFDLEIDLSEVKRQVRLAAEMLALA